MKLLPRIVSIGATGDKIKELQREEFACQYDIHFYQSSVSRLYTNSISSLKKNIKKDSLQRLFKDACSFFEKIKPDGLFATKDYPESILVAMLSGEYGLCGPSAQAVAICHHKYYARCAQKRYVPEVTPDFRLFQSENDSMEFPFFVKPIKSFFSFGAHIVSDIATMRAIQKDSLLAGLFLEQFNEFMSQYTNFQPIKNVLLMEELLSGVQCTYEGLVQNGKVQSIGIVDSIMFPGTISFKRFEYPSQLSLSVQERMHVAAEKLILGIGLDNTLFNIEFMYDAKTDTLRIIEINPRMASQFADLYEKVDGISSYHHAIDISLGKLPRLVKNKGTHKVAASCVLRLFEDKLVSKTPTQKEIEQFYTQFPDGRFQCFVKVGQRLSDVFQDGKSYRYGLVHLGARDRQELLEKFECAQKILHFELE